MKTMIEACPWTQLSRLAVVALFLLSLVFGCEGAGIQTIGGETHFLRACDSAAGADQCGEGLACLCNVCTVTCDEQSTCAGYPDAVCVSATAKCGAEARVCDVECAEDSDCAAVSSAHYCEQGYCRAPADAVGSVEMTLCPGGTVSASRLLIIGDNMLAGPNPVGAELEASAQGAGFIGEDAELNDHSSATNNALAYMGGGIPAQYAAGNPDSEVRWVVMNGGGVDAVFGTCEAANAECPALAAAATAAEALLGQMASDGVEHVLYAFYPDPADAGQKERVDALRPLIQNVCDEAPLACRILDLRPVFENHYDEYVVPEGLTEAGSQATAQAIWAQLEDCLTL